MVEAARDSTAFNCSSVSTETLVLALGVESVSNGKETSYRI